jgi:hypothetical protein
MLTKNGSSKFILGLGITCAFLYVVYLQFLSPAFCDPDSYYHIAVSNFIKSYGLHYPFHWVQFSSFKDSFSDKDILFHVFNLPFLFLTDNLVLAGKYAFIFHAGLFIFAYVFILKKYLPDFLAAVFLLFPFSSSTFSAYFLQLRPATPANIFLILGIYFLINKRLAGLFIISLLYALTHISFLMITVVAFACEILRWLIKKDFFAKNIYVTFAGVICGCLIHPDFPRNLFSLYLNGIVVPLYGLTGTDLGFGSEMQAFDTTFTFISNFTVFLGLNVIIWLTFLAKRTLSLATSVWFASTGIYLFLAFFGNRYWYQANVLFFIFFASCLNDWAEDKGWASFMQRLKFPAALYFIISLVFFVPNLKQLKGFMEFSCTRSMHFENAGRWMNKNIPADQTIYHSYWTDSPYFICLNPKDNYINALDPIYMFYRYPRELKLLNELSLGRVDKPYEAIGRIFKAKYGYLNKFEPLYRQINDYPRYFKILYEDNEGIVFALR